jgi:hypothetical protein
VLDFGIAKAVGTGSTKQHSLLGTLKYMAPEQIADPGSVSPATDIYSLGAILYECLAGCPPHIAETEPELMFKIMNTDPIPLTALLPSLDSSLSSVVARALHRDPERRYASAVALAGALASCLVAYGEESHGEATPRAEPRLPRWVSGLRSKAWLVVGLAVGMLLGASLGPLYRVRSMAAAAVASVTPSKLATVAAPTPVAVLSSGLAPSEPVAPTPAATVDPPPLHRVGATVANRNVRPTLPALDDRNPYE